MKWRCYLDDCVCVIFTGSYEDTVRLHPNAWAIKEV